MASAFDTTLAGLGIKTTAAVTAAKNAPSSTSKSQATLGQADFLKLMTAQLNNQDPFNPVDNTQMVAQMAQFSSVAGIGEMNATLTGIATKLGATSAADAMSYVGKTVLTAGTTAYSRSTGGIAGAVELGGDATDTRLTISDASGAVLKTMSLGPQKAGSVAYDWDGTTDSGAAAGAGPFTVSAVAQNNGIVVSAQPLVWAPVESISLPSGGDPVLSVTGLGQVKPSAVRSVG